MFEENMLNWKIYMILDIFGPSTISTSESELMDRTYMVTPTLTAWPETQSYICGGQLLHCKPSLDENIQFLTQSETLYFNS